MALTKGWNGEIVFSAKILKEDVGVTNASGGDKYYLNQYPVVNANNSITADTSNISVILNQSKDANGSNIYIVNTSMNLSGTNGVFGFSANCSHDLGVTIEATYMYREVVGYATGISFAHTTDLEGAFTVGARTPAEVLVGRGEISGSISEFFADRRAFMRSYGGDLTGDLTPLTIEVSYPASNASFKLTGVQVNGWSIDETEDAIVAQNCDFLASNISLYK